MFREDNKQLKYVLYVRRSIKANKTEEDKGVPSIESQKTEIKALAEKHGLLIMEEFEETVSASEPGMRPQFQRVDRF